MNKKRREKLQDAITHLGQAVRIVEGVREEEAESMENTPEGLQGSERYEAMENAIDALDDAITSINEANESIEQACK